MCVITTGSSYLMQLFYKETVAAGSSQAGLSAVPNESSGSVTALYWALPHAAEHHRAVLLLVLMQVRVCVCLRV